MNIDQAILAQDFSLVSMQSVMNGRLAAYMALGQAMAALPGLDLSDSAFGLVASIESSSFTARLGGYLILTSLATEQGSRAETTHSSLKTMTDIAEKNLTCTSPTWDELADGLARLRSGFQTVLDGWEKTQRPVEVPRLRSALEEMKQVSDFTTFLDRLRTLSKTHPAPSKNTTRRETERLKDLGFKIDQLKEKIEECEISLRAAEAGFLISMKSVPAKPGVLVKGLMSSIKSERHYGLQHRSAVSMAKLLMIAGTEQSRISLNVVEKILKNLQSFLCLDAGFTPIFKRETAVRTGVIHLQTDLIPVRYETESGEEAPALVKDEQIVQRGAYATFEACAVEFGGSLFFNLPRLAEMTIEMLKSMSSKNLDELDDQCGQKILDGLTTLSCLVPHLHADLANAAVQICLDPLLRLNESAWAAVRASSARLLGILARYLPTITMPFVVKVVVKNFDSQDTCKRQGAVQAVQSKSRILGSQL